MLTESSPLKAPMENLTKLLDHEMSYKRTAQRTGISRHSRFGTTISVMDVCPGVQIRELLAKILTASHRGPIDISFISRKQSPTLQEESLIL
jgi:hypothetical protein